MVKAHQLILLCWIMTVPVESFVVLHKPSARPITPSRQFLFGGIFSGESTTEDSLAVYPKLGQGEVQFESLTDYIQQWSTLFETKLTTPATIQPVNNVATEGVAEASGVQFLFKKGNTGYKDKDDAKGKEGSSEKKKAAKHGGVEVLVEKFADGSVQVRASRCEMDEDTMIKEMSEETILTELKKAIGVWKKEH